MSKFTLISLPTIHAMDGVGVEMTGEAAAARPPGNNFEKNRTAYLLVLSLELIALLSVCLITMVRKIVNK